MGKGRGGNGRAAAGAGKKKKKGEARETASHMEAAPPPAINTDALPDRQARSERANKP
jgi:hypothetical protein